MNVSVGNVLGFDKRRQEKKICKFVRFATPGTCASTWMEETREDKRRQKEDKMRGGEGGTSLTEMEALVLCSKRGTI